MRLRIGVDARSLGEPPGGLRRHLTELLAALLAAAPETDFSCYLTPSDPAPETSGRGRVLRVPGSRRSLLRPLWELRSLPRTLAAEPPDVFLAASGAVPGGRACPVVAVVHDLAYLRQPGWFRWPHRLYWRSVSARLPRAAQLLAVSQATRDDCLRHGLAPERVHLVPNAPSRVFFRRPAEEARAARERCSLPEGFALAVGAWDDPRKNLVRLAAAAARAGVVLAVVGAVPRRAPANVRLLGGRSDDELAALMSAAGAFAVPSLDEGFGLPLLEAMACGAPCLAARAGALPEVAGAGAWLVPPEDVAGWAEALRRLRDGPEERAALQARGRARAAAFSWERSARLALEVLHRAAAAGRARV